MSIMGNPEWKFLVPYTSTNPLGCTGDAFAGFYCSPEQHHIIVRPCIQKTQVTDFCQALDLCCNMTLVTYQQTTVHVLTLDRTITLISNTTGKSMDRIDAESIQKNTAKVCEIVDSLQQTKSWSCDQNSEMDPFILF